jgi:hypothetical protein
MHGANWGSQDPAERGLYRLSGGVAWLLLAYSAVTMAIILTLGGPPATAREAFALLQQSRLEGMLRADLLTVLCVPLYLLLFAGLYLALHHTSHIYAGLATSLAFVGIALFLAAPSVFSLVYLSDRFASASTEAEQTQLLAAAEAILASDIWHGTGPFIGGILLQSATVMICVVMLRSRVFRPLIAYVGIVTHSLDLGHILISPVAPEAGFVLMAIGGPLYLLWFPLVGWRLHQLGAPELDCGA